MPKRFVECTQTGIAIHELWISTNDAFTDADVPPDRLMIDVTDRPDIVVGQQLKDVPLDRRALMATRDSVFVRPAK